MKFMALKTHEGWWELRMKRGKHWPVILRDDCDTVLALTNCLRDIPVDLTLGQIKKLEEIRPRGWEPSKYFPHCQRCKTLAVQREEEYCPRCVVITGRRIDAN